LKVRQYLKSASAGPSERFNAFHLLCALREGPHGVGTINASIEDLAVRHALIRGTAGGTKAGLMIFQRCGKLTTAISAVLSGC
jgi:hypothetical protein